MKPTLVIMAAGLGRRYGGLKQIDRVGPNGEMLLEYALYDAIRAGFGKAVCVIRREWAPAFQAQLFGRFTKRIDIQYAFQSLDHLPAEFSAPEGRTKPWGTAQAVLACSGLIREPFAVQNADDFYGIEAYRTIAEQLVRLTENESCMIGYRLKNTLSPYGPVSRGVCAATAEGYLSEITERTLIEADTAGRIQYVENGADADMTGNEIVSMNFWGFTPVFFRKLETQFIDFLKKNRGEMESEWYLPAVVGGMLQRNEICVKVLHSEGKWLGMTHPADRRTAAALLKTMHNTGIYPAEGLHTEILP